MTPGLTITLNGTTLVTISSDGLNMLNVRVSGDRISSEFASLDVSGGLYGDEGDKKHLLWESDHVIFPGDEIAVTLLENTSTSRLGKTIDELYPEDQEKHGPWQPIEQVFRDLAQKPTLREQFTFTITPPAAPSIRTKTLPDDHSFIFSVTWAWLHPDQARVSLTSNTLKGIAKREGGSDHARFLLHYGQRVQFRADV